MPRIRLFGGRSLTVTNALLSRSYKLSYNRWTEVDNPEDLEYLLSHDFCMVEEEKSLAPAFIEVISPQPVRLHYEQGNSEKKEVFWPGRIYEVPQHIYRGLRKHSGVRVVPVSQVLPKESKARVLINRGGGLGDLLLLTPAIETLHREFPKAELWMATAVWHKRVFQGNKAISHIITLKEAYDEAPFDYFVNLTWYVEAAKEQHKHRTDLFAGAFGFENPAITKCATL